MLYVAISDDVLGHLNFSVHPKRSCDYINEEYQSFDESPVYNKLSVFPNPCLNTLHLVLPGNGEHNMSIYDKTGKAIRHFTTHTKLLKPDLAEYLAGVYYLSVRA